MFTLAPLNITLNSLPKSDTDLHSMPHPGDLSHFLSFESEKFWGANYHDKYRNPMLAVPSTEGQGGTIYYENQIGRDTLAAAMRAMNMVDAPGAPKKFVVYASESKKPGEEGYLRQLRFISHFAMEFLFRVIDRQKVQDLPTQELTLEEAVWLFVQEERNHWGTSFGAPKLETLFGGDGHFAREELSFVLSVESSYYQVFRLWSRAWLVTK